MSINITQKPEFNVVNVGEEISQDAVEAISAASAPSALNPFVTVSGIPAPAGTDIQVFGGPTSSGVFTWTKPANAKMIWFMISGGGGGGGGGGCQATTTARFGGGGGGAGMYSVYFLPADMFGPTVSVTVGAGGTGGAGRSTAGSPSAGTNGGHSLFGSFQSGLGTGAGSSGTGGGSGQGYLFGIANTLSGSNGSSGASGLSMPAFGNASFAPQGGSGACGAAANSTTIQNGQAGAGRMGTTGNATGYIPALAGGVGANSTTPTAAGNGQDADILMAHGTGGGSGGYKTASTGIWLNGGNGGWPSGGGGGGGATDLGFLSGTGGNGGNGRVIVITYV